MSVGCNPATPTFFFLDFPINFLYVCSMKKLLQFLLLLSIVSISFTTIYKTLDNGTFVKSVSLKNGESILLNEIFDWRGFLPIIQDGSHDLDNSAIIKAFEKHQFNFSYIDRYINSIQELRRLGYWNILNGKKNIYDGFYTSHNKISPLNTIYDFDNTYPQHPKLKPLNYKGYLPDGFEEYYHSLFQSKTCRKLMFNSSLDIIDDMCRRSPSDFLVRVNYELDELIQLTNISTYYKTAFNQDVSYFKGFVHRRVETDNVPLDEIHNYLIEAKRRLSIIDVDELDAALYEIRINGDMQILLNSNGYYLIKDQKKLNYTFSTPIKSIKYLEDNSGRYYLVEGDGFRDLYDSELNMVD